MNHAQNFLGTEQSFLLRQTALMPYLQHLSRALFPSNASLLTLTEQLIIWNQQRISRSNNSKQDLSIEDVATLKKLIDTAIHRSTVQCSEVFSDQILFLVIGAIQIQAQTHSEKAWQLVKQSIQINIEAKQEKKVLQLSFCTTALIISLSAMINFNAQVHPIHHAPTNFAIEESISDADPVTISMLELAYKKMKSGTCQLPQAAMLPEDQRNAYLKFINKGVIEVQQVESLRKALGYVSCLYPQELMRPIIPSKN